MLPEGIESRDASLNTLERRGAQQHVARREHEVRGKGAGQRPCGRWGGVDLGNR